MYEIEDGNDENYINVENFLECIHGLAFPPPPFHYLYSFFIGIPYITTTNRSHQG